MKASELRIGNYILRFDIGDNSRREENVIELRKDSVLVSGPISVICQYDQIFPIPLTEEWLLKFGFEKGYGIKWIHPKFGFSLKKSVGIYKSDVLPEIKNVHQLQNLYFAICDEELELLK